MTLKNKLMSSVAPLLYIYFCDVVIYFPLQAPLISSREYKEWRESGVAFKLRGDAPYQVPNRTMASGLLLREVSSAVSPGACCMCVRMYGGDKVAGILCVFDGLC